MGKFMSRALWEDKHEFVNTFLDHAYVDIKLFTQQQEEKKEKNEGKKKKKEKKEKEKEKEKKKKSRVNFLPIISPEKYLFVEHTRRINPRSLLFTSKYSRIFLLFIEQTNPDRNSQCQDEGKSSSDVELKLDCHHYSLYIYRIFAIRTPGRLLEIFGRG